MFCSSLSARTNLSGKLLDAEIPPLLSFTALVSSWYIFFEQDRVVTAEFALLEHNDVYGFLLCSHPKLITPVTRHLLLVLLVSFPKKTSIKILAHHVTPRNHHHADLQYLHWTSLLNAAPFYTSFTMHVLLNCLESKSFWQQDVVKHKQQGCAWKKKNWDVGAWLPCWYWTSLKKKEAGSRPVLVRNWGLNWTLELGPRIKIK